MTAKIQQSLRRLCHWVEDHGYKAYDPGDGQLSVLRPLALGHPFFHRLLTAGVLRSPFNIRPWIGIPPHISTKGMGYMAWGYTKLYAQTGERSYAEKAKSCLTWLVEHRAPAYKNYCWGNHFAFTTRAGTIPAHEPTIVWSGLIGQAFLEAHRVFCDPKYLDAAISICEWIMTLPRERTDSGSCLSYVMIEQSSIHNSNMLGAALLGQVGHTIGNSKFMEIARDAMLYSVSRQNADGSWWYGHERKYHWIDNFHTGYNLDSLKRYIQASGDTSFESQMHRGSEYLKANFFEPSDRPKYYHNRTYPTDIQCAAQAIDTLAFFSDEDPEALGLSQRVANWTIDNMQAPDGHFYYRDLGWTMIKTPMLHWGQGTMCKALAHLLGKLKHGKSDVRDQKSEFRNQNSLNPQPSALAPSVQIPSSALSLQPSAFREDPQPSTFNSVPGPQGATHSRQLSTLNYVLITPARNEEALIEGTIRAVVAQTILPTKWIIVSDGSTDGTDDVVRRYAVKHPWIELLRMPERCDRQFAAKAHAFNAGYARISTLNSQPSTSWDIIGNLDADITFDPEYFSFLLSKFQLFPKLGVAGTPFVEDATQRDRHTYAHRFAQLEHVSGACQMFRRECFEQVGGYVPIKGGAIDWIAVTTARMKGWQTRTFLEKTCLHHRKIGTGTDSALMAHFRYGQKAYYVGGHPLWELLRGISRMRTKPRLLGGLYFQSGFLWAALTRMNRPVPAELISFHRAEQMARLRQSVTGLIHT